MTKPDFIKVPDGFLGFFNGCECSFVFIDKETALKFCDENPNDNNLLFEHEGFWVWAMDWI